VRWRVLSTLAFMALSGCRGSKSNAAPALVRVVRAAPDLPGAPATDNRGRALAGTAEWQIVDSYQSPPRPRSMGLVVVRFTLTNRGPTTATMWRRPLAHPSDGAIVEPRAEDHSDAPVTLRAIDVAPLAPSTSRSVWLVYDIEDRSRLEGFRVPGFRVEDEYAVVIGTDPPVNAALGTLSPAHAVATAVTVPTVPSPRSTAESHTTWFTTARDHRGLDGQTFTYNCPGNGIALSVWGTDVYSDDSSVCTAAVHAGLITRATGGTVTIEIQPGRRRYQGSERRGVNSSDYGNWDGSFAFTRGTVTTPTWRSPPAAPQPTVAEAGQTCEHDYECSSNNCTARQCQSTALGAPCQHDYHCSSNNCTAGQCQNTALGAPCQHDYHCSSNNCTAGQCQSTASGATCQHDYHCASNSCVSGRCQ
jgi:hypothetical protein